MIETLAAYATVIEFVVKAAKYGSDLVRRVLIETTSTIQDDPDIDNVEEARRFLEETLERKLGTDTASRTVKDLSAMEDLLSQNSLLMMWSTFGVGDYTVLPYAAVLDSVVIDIGRKLDAWHCFEQWAERHTMRHWSRGSIGAGPIPVNHYYLPFPNTGKGIKRSGLLKGEIKAGVLRRLRGYLARPISRSDLGYQESYPEYYIAMHMGKYEKSIWQIRQPAPYPPGECTVKALRQVSLHFHGQTEYYYGPHHDYATANSTVVRMGTTPLPLTYAGFQPILLGLLLDFVRYSHRARQQASRGRDLIHKLTSWR